MLRKFFDANRRLCDWIEDRLPRDFTLNYNRLFVDTVAAKINRTSGKIVVDVGAGKTCHFLSKLGAESRPVLIGVDVAEEEIRDNGDLAMRIVGDVARGPLFRTDSIDFLVSRSVVEHLPDNAAFVAHSARALRSGGYFIHLFPGRYAPFAVINRLLPDAVARALLYFFFPEFRDPCGFKAFYDRCYYSAMAKALTDNGLVVESIHLRYYQSLYFKFFAPFYLISLLYDLLVYWSGFKNLGSQLLVVATKP